MKGAYSCIRSLQLYKVDNPQISVIIPVYNVNSYLLSFFRSLQAQNYDDAEIIFIDDGSTDGSSETLDFFARSSPVNVIHQENGGVGQARNTGLDAARGKYLVFIDPDDDISPNYLQRLSEPLRDTGVDIVLTDWAEVHEKKVIEHVVNSSNIITKLDPEDVIRKSLSGGNINGGVLWAKMFASRLFRHNRFPLTRTSEDILPCYKALLMAREIVYTPHAKYSYTARRSNSLTHVYRLSDIDSAFSIQQELTHLIHEIYPELDSLTRESEVDSYLQACRRICRSNSVEDKPKEFRRYQSVIRNNLHSIIVNTNFSLKEKSLFIIASLGYWPTQISLNYWDRTVKGNR